MRVHIESEIGPLEQVLVHRPGLEIERMTQHELEGLLFDDILSPTDAALEHDLMTDIIRGQGAEVLYVEDLLTEALHEAPARDVRDLVDAVCTLAGARELHEMLADWAPDRLARALVSGVLWPEVTDAPPSLARMRASFYDPSHLALRPQPNLMFMRDPCMSVYDRVVVGSMATAARAREPYLVEFAIHWATEAASAGYLRVGDLDMAPNLRCLEGGDLLVVSPRFLLVGCSERTRAQAIEEFAHAGLFDAFPDLERIYAVLMPEARSVMHLDTILTQIDQRTFLGYRPLLCGEGETEAMPVAVLERRSEPRLLDGHTIIDVLKGELGDIELVPCGGDDRIRQDREQWTDGANAFCLAPGKILLYSRNVGTVEALKERGYAAVLLNVAQPPELRAQLIREGFEQERCVFCFSGSELSRARGGGRCLTMPLSRRSLDEST